MAQLQAWDGELVAVLQIRAYTILAASWVTRKAVGFMPFRALLGRRLPAHLACGPGASSSSGVICRWGLGLGCCIWFPHDAPETSHLCVQYTFLCNLFCLALLWEVGLLFLLNLELSSCCFYLLCQNRCIFYNYRFPNLKFLKFCSLDVRHFFKI